MLAAQMIESAIHNELIERIGFTNRISTGIDCEMMLIVAENNTRFITIHPTGHQRTDTANRFIRVATPPRVNTNIDPSTACKSIGPWRVAVRTKAEPFHTAGLDDVACRLDHLGVKATGTHGTKEVPAIGRDRHAGTR